MKRNLSMFAILLASILFMTSCDTLEDEISYIPSQPEPDTQVSVEEELSELPFELEAVGRAEELGVELVYFRDTTTDVLYLYSSSYRKGGLTVMLEPETGLPLTYTRYMELYNQNR